MIQKTLLYFILACCAVTFADDHSEDHAWEQSHIEKNQDNIKRLEVEIATLKVHDHVDLQKELKELREVHLQILGALSFINKAIIAFGVVLVPLIVMFISQFITARRNGHNR